MQNLGQYNLRDICNGFGQRCYCRNDTENLTAECCVSGNNGDVTCETCDIDTKTGDYVNCVITTGFTKGGSNLPGAPHHGAVLATGNGSAVAADHGSAVGGHD